MAYESVKIREIVERAVSHTWSIPEFQRGFVWKATQVRDLAESLWLDYPIGSLLAWNSPKPAEEQIAKDAQQPSLWVVDGQQRATALCVLFGRKPYWWTSADEWHKTLRKYDIRFDIDAKEPPYFWVANAAIRNTKVDRYIPLSKLLVLDIDKAKDQQTLRELAKEIKLQGLCDRLDAMDVYVQLLRICQIRDKDIVTVTIQQELEDVVEIFRRLNSLGTRVTEADIYLGIVAAKTPGWVKSTFLPYLKNLADAGFDISPNLLFRTLTAVGAHKVRFKEIPERFWSEVHLHWDHVTTAWKNLILRFREYGILSNDPMPTETALVTMIALLDRFPQEPFEPILYWFLQASRFGRYSGSSTTALEDDLATLQRADSLGSAIRELLRHFPTNRPLIPEDDFLRDYGDSRFGRFLLYLLVYRNKAHDWDSTGHRIGFDGLELLANFQPQWHHIFPHKFLDGKVDDDKVNALANIAVIGPGINIRISAKAPMVYIQRYAISPLKLEQQYIAPDITTMSVNDYDNWLLARARMLADAGNVFLDELSRSL